MIKNKLAVLLAERKMNIQDVADKTGLSRTTISALVNETAKGIHIKTLDILCENLNCTPGDIFKFQSDAVTDAIKFLSKQRYTGGWD